MSVWIYPQEAVEIPRSINQEVFEPTLLAIRQRIAPDFLTDSHQECSFRFIHQQLFCLLAADNTWQGIKGVAMKTTALAELSRSNETNSQHK